MNLRTVSRGDAALAGAALLLLISSFLPFYSSACGFNDRTCTANAWHSAWFPLLPSVFLVGLIAAALILASRLLPQGDVKLAGIQLSHWGTVLAVSSAWAALWALMGGPADSHGAGAYLGLLFALVLAAVAVAGPLVPALAAPLLPNAPAPGAPGVAGPGGYPAYGQQGPQGQQGAQGQPGQSGQYPYQGQQFQHGEPVQQAQPGQPFTGPQSPSAPQAGYGYPQQAQTPAPAPSYGGGANYGAPAPAPEPRDVTPAQDPSTARLTAPAAATPTPTPTPAPAPAPAAPAAPAFSPFWFAVPAPRPLAPENDPNGPSVGDLVPGTWYLAIAQRGDALLTQTQEHKRGLLVDTSGIQRG